MRKGRAAVSPKCSVAVRWRPAAAGEKGLSDRRPRRSDWGLQSLSSVSEENRRSQGLEQPKQRLKRLKVSIYDTHAHTRMSSYTRNLSRFSRFSSSIYALTCGFRKRLRATEERFSRCSFSRCVAEGRGGAATQATEATGARTQTPSPSPLPPLPTAAISLPASATPADPWLRVAPEARHRVDNVALGDSYASEPLMPDQGDATCQRSDHNYASLVARKTRAALTDATCQAHYLRLPPGQGTGAQRDAGPPSPPRRGRVREHLHPDHQHDLCAPRADRWTETFAPETPAAPVHPNGAGEQAMSGAVQRTLSPAEPTPTPGPPGPSQALLISGGFTP